LASQLHDAVATSRVDAGSPRVPSLDRAEAVRPPRAYAERRSASLLEQIGDAFEIKRDAQFVPAAAPVAT
jgi:hypothetical protein